MEDGLDALSAKYKIHEESRSYLQQTLEVLRDGQCFDVSPKEMRKTHEAMMTRFGGEVDFDGTVQEFMVPSAACKAGIPVDVIKPKICSRRPQLLVYFHEGAMMFGSRAESEAVCKILARDASCVVINVEYRLAPEHKFPAAFEDAKCVLRWVMMNKSLLGGMNDSTVGVCGAAAGATLAATVSHEVHSIAYQVLVYPLLDMRCGQPSCSEPVIEKIFSRDWLVREVLNDEEEMKNPRASPILQPDVRNTPATLFIVAEIDPLRDQAYEYKRKLKEAGVEVESLMLKGSVHGFFSLPVHFKELNQRARDKVLSFMKKKST